MNFSAEIFLFLKGGKIFMRELFEPKNLRKTLAENNYKMTPQRKGILQVFVDYPDEHLSAEEVYDILQEKDLDLSLIHI